MHAPVIPVRIIPLQHPTVQENKFTRLKEFFLCYFNKCFFGLANFFFSKHHNFSYILQPPYKSKKIMSFFLSKRLQNVASSGFLQFFLFLVYLEKYFQE